MSEPTIFSQTRCVVFASPVTRSEAGVRLQEFVKALARPLLYGKAVLGHIKMIARIPGETEFLFLSLTAMDRVDVKPSPDWPCADCVPIGCLEIKINVLVFGYSMASVEEVVETSLQELSWGYPAST